MSENKQRSLGRPKTNERKQPTNELIIQTASKLFLENGYQDVSMDDVASACNVTKATVYYYYKTKALLYTETMVQLMYRIRENILLILNENKPLKDKLLHVAEVYLQVAIDIDMERVMHSAKNTLTEEQIKQIHAAEDYMYEGMEEAFQKAINNREIEFVHATFAVHAFISLLKIGNYQNANEERLFDNHKEAAKEIVDFFWSGLIRN